MKPHLQTFGKIISLLLLAIFFLASCEATGGGGAASPPVNNQGKANVETIDILVLESFPVQIHAVVRGTLPDGCSKIGMITQRKDLETKTFWVEIPTTRPADAICTQVVAPFEETIALDVYGLPAGTYTVNVNGVPATFTLDVDNAP